MLIKAANQIKNATQYSWQGLCFLLKSEMAARLEVYLFCVLFVFFFLLGEPRSSFLYLIFIFSILIAVEALNTAIEVVIDKISPEFSEAGKNAKDLGSFAVMCILMAIFVFITGVVLTADWGHFFNILTAPLGRTFLALLFIILAIYSLVKISFKGKLKWALLGIIGFLFIGSIAHNAASYFTGGGIDEKVLFHLKTGFGGAGLREYWALITVSILAVILALFTLVLTNDIFGKAKFYLSKKIITLIRWEGNEKKISKVHSKASPSPSKIYSWNAAIFLSCAMIINPISLNLASLIKEAVENMVLADQLDFYTLPQIEPLTNKKNIVFLYLEGLERTYLDEARFPGLAENLSALEKESTSFIDIIDTLGSGWTIAGLVSTQCGVPLYTSGQGNAVSEVDQFMPEAICMGDILKANGYNTTFMGGAKLEFAGKGKFLKSHGFLDVKGREYFEKKITAPSSFTWWGLTDPYLFEELLSEVKDLMQKDKPFAVMGLTLDTHAPNGHKTPQCKDITYGDGKNTFLNAIKCSDKMIYEFVQNLRNLDGLKNTIIVIASDHLSMRSIDELTTLSKKGERRNLFLILDDNPNNDGLIKRNGSQFDVGATILSQLGMNINEFGFGRNLLNEAPTLVEYAEGQHNKILRQAKDILIERLWNYPNLTKKMKVNFDKKTLQLEKRSVPLPVLFKLDDEHDVLEVIFKNKASPKDLKDYLPKGHDFVWIDACDPMIERNPKFKIPPEGNPWCWSIGNKDGDIKYSEIVGPRGVLLKQELLSFLD